MLRNYETVRPIFSKIMSKVAQDFKEKSRKSAVRGEIFLRNYREKCGGGGLLGPPPVFLGLTSIIVNQNFNKKYQVAAYW